MHHETITQLSILFGCYSLIKRDFEADFNNIEYVSIMNDNWDFDYILGEISAHKGIDITKPHQSLTSDVAPIYDV